jgi:rubredoxin
MSLAKTTLIPKETMLMNIILYLLQIIQYLYQQNIWLINFICKYIPLKQWAFDDSHSPKYQKFKVDKLPLILHVEPWDYRDFMKYLEWRYKDDYKPIKPVRRRGECDIPDDCKCPDVMLPKSIFTRTMVPKDRSFAKYARTPFTRNLRKYHA